MVLVPGEAHPRQAAADAGLEGADGGAGGVLPQVTVDAEGAEEEIETQLLNPLSLIPGPLSSLHSPLPFLTTLSSPFPHYTHYYYTLLPLSPPYSVLIYSPLYILTTLSSPFP